MELNDERLVVVCEVVLEYKEHIPTVYEAIDWDVIKDRFLDENSILNEIVVSSSLTKREIKKMVEEEIAQFILPIIFSNINEKQSYQKSLEVFLNNYIFDDRAYNYFMKNMPEFRELEESLSPKWRKKFAKGRHRSKFADGVSAFRSLGLTALIGRKSSKYLEEQSKNPLIRDIVVLLRLAGYWSND